ncbi:hypothetical protein ASC61_09635 [Aeromicrobium sp. Root344]|uniref:hypothetical protein n=1 Tax=Aeromicrobium sp. Root344 TaxID=1736521 RepID=UPI0006FA2211|nr:hypothetical protein [Aeromicrobium sp. Root344]KQV75241.1 hypothetical protein ASC61_09635 [Aeromicrobium sp. Root344]
MTQDESAATNEPHEDDALERKIRDQPDIAPGAWVKRIVLAIVLLVVAYVGFRVSAAFFPRWWAHRVGDQVGDSLTKGTLWGLFYGFVFTFVPLLLLFQIRRRFFSWTWRIVVAVVALLLAAPNWLTLSVVAGNSKAAHAGERIFDVEAPGFRAGTLSGVIAGAVLALIVTGTSMQMRHRKKEVKRLRGERDELKRAQADHTRDDESS